MIVDPEISPTLFIDQTLPKYASSDELAEIHEQASKLLSELESESVDTTFKFESSLQELQRAKNKLTYEIELLNGDVSSIIQDSKEVAPKVIKVCEPASNSEIIKTWRDLDVVKKRMDQVQQVFKQAKEFDHERISNDVDSKLNGGLIDEALEIIENASSICGVWKGTLEYSKHQKFITGLKRRVETWIENDRKTKEARSSPAPRTAAAGTSTSPASPSSPRASTGRSYYSFIDQFGRSVF